MESPLIAYKLLHICKNRKKSLKNLHINSEGWQETEVIRKINLNLLLHANHCALRQARQGYTRSGFNIRVDKNSSLKVLSFDIVESFNAKVLCCVTQFLLNSKQLIVFGNSVCP